MARATQSAFVNPPAIRGDVHAEKVALCAIVTAILGTANVKIVMVTGFRLTTVFSYSFDQLHPQFKFIFILFFK